MRIKFKSVATGVALYLALQPHADTLTGKVINVADGHRPLLLLELSKMVNAEVRASGELINSCR